MGSIRYIALAIAVTAVATAQGVANSTPEDRIAKQKASTATEEPNTTDAAKQNPPATVVVNQGNTDHQQEPEKRDNENIQIQRKLVQFNLWLVVVGVLQAIILGFTIRAINRQTKSTQNTERAWVMAGIDHNPNEWRDGKAHIIRGSGTEGDTTAVLSVFLSIKNEGKSPAWIYEKRAKFEIVSAVSPQPQLEDAQFVYLEPTILGIGQSIPNSETLEWTPVALGHTQFGKMPFMYGVIKYTDIFNKRRETRFGYQLSPDGEFTRVTNREYNKQT